MAGDEELKKMKEMGEVDKMEEGRRIGRGCRRSEMTEVTQVSERLPGKNYLILSLNGSLEVYTYSLFGRSCPAKQASFQLIGNRKIRFGFTWATGMENVCRFVPNQDIVPGLKYVNWITLNIVELICI